MEAITSHQIQFGELAGPLLQGATFFDWELIATQAVAAGFDYPFRDILADGGIPYAPVVVNTSVNQYPTIEDTITVEVSVLDVGNSSVELLYEMRNASGTELATARMSHVTIAPDGKALPLPDDVRSNFADARVDRDPEVGPGEASRRQNASNYCSFSSLVEIRSPHVEGAELAYFEEYPRFAKVALEEYLEDQGTSLGGLSSQKHPFRIRNWRWEHKSPVRFETTLRVESDVIEAEGDTVRVAHTFFSDGEVSIDGITEYGCFDSSGASVPFDEATLVLLKA